MAATSYNFRWQKVPVDEYTITKISDDEYQVVFGEDEIYITLKAVEGELENA